MIDNDKKQQILNILNRANNINNAYNDKSAVRVVDTGNNSQKILNISAEAKLNGDGENFSVKIGPIYKNNDYNQSLIQAFNTCINKYKKIFYKGVGQLQPVHSNHKPEDYYIFQCFPYKSTLSKITNRKAKLFYQFWDEIGQMLQEITTKYNRKEGQKEVRYQYHNQHSLGYGSLCMLVVDSLKRLAGLNDDDDYGVFGDTDDIKVNDIELDFDENSKGQSMMVQDQDERVNIRFITSFINNYIEKYSQSLRDFDKEQKRDLKVVTLAYFKNRLYGINMPDNMLQFYHNNFEEIYEIYNAFNNYEDDKLNKMKKLINRQLQSYNRNNNNNQNLNESLFFQMLDRMEKSKKNLIY